MLIRARLKEINFKISFICHSWVRIPSALRTHRRSSIGRVIVSKTIGSRFESLRLCNYGAYNLKVKRVACGATNLSSSLSKHPKVREHVGRASDCRSDINGFDSHTYRKYYGNKMRSL